MKAAMHRSGKLPLWFKLAYLAVVAVMAPVYLAYYGAVNFLWFSNLALVLGLVAAWLEHARLASMMAVSVTLLEVGWIIGYLSGLARGGDPWLGLVAYMFNPEIPAFVRGVSLYHLVLPFALLWMVWRLGYDHTAWKSWIPVGWLVLAASWLLAPAGRNINWVRGPIEAGVDRWPGLAWLAVLMMGCALAWWLTHHFIAWLLRRLPQPRAGAYPSR